MDKDIIIERETANDGQTVNLFYDDMAGLYVAYGLSAYYVTMVLNPYVSYSRTMGMPLVLLNRGHILLLRQSLTKVEHVEKSYYVFRLRMKIGNEGYERWKQKILDPSIMT